jgi:hypothetical protein
MKKLLVMCCVLIGSKSFAQKTNFYISAGPVIPLGKEISSSFSLGFGILIGPRVNFNNIFISPQAASKIFINNPSTSIKDNLLTYGVVLNGGYSIKLAKLVIEPHIGIGYSWGNNFLTNRSSDFTGGYLSKTVSLVNLDGLNYNIGCVIMISQKIGVGAHYQVNRPNASVTDDTIQATPSSNTSSQLYGNLVSFPKQKMSLDNLALTFNLKL